MKLYFTPGTCSLAAHIALREAGLPFELERVSLSTKKTASGADFLALNPKGYVPVLALDDGFALTEVAAILFYIADQKPEVGLAPAAGSRQRYELYGWLSFIGTELHKQFFALFKNGAPEEWRTHQREYIGGRIAWLDGELASRPFLMGEAFGVADAYLYVVLRWTALTGIDRPKWAHVQAHFERVEARPAVQEALKVEGLLK